MSTDLTSQEVAQWLRDRAREYEEAARMVERTCNGQGKADGLHGLSISHTASDHVSVEKLREIMVEKKHVRLKTLADLTGARKGTIRKLITPENGFEFLNQGWIGLKKNN